jgi:hypothetical protein
MDELLAESELMAQRRKESAEMLDALQKANQVISEVCFMHKKLLIYVGLDSRDTDLVNDPVLYQSYIAITSRTSFMHDQYCSFI